MDQVGDKYLLECTDVPAMENHISGILNQGVEEGNGRRVETELDRKNMVLPQFFL
jgi:hypothetical protein